MIFEIENKSVYASDAGRELDHKKETIIFLHGSGLSHIVWSLVEQFFSNQNYNVLSIDIPGHGNSEGPCLKTIEEITDWLEKVFIKLKLEKVILVGHSQGCLEMLEYSNKYKNRLKKLVFLGGSYKMPVNQDLIDLAENGDTDAVKFDELSYIEVLKKGLKVMDSTSVSLCMDNKLPMVIFNFRHKHSIKRVLLGEKIGTTVGV